MRINIYMKSGNKITLRGIKKWEFSAVGNNVERIMLQRHWWHFGENLIISTIDLSQIEAVTQS